MSRAASGLSAPAPRQAVIEEPPYEKPELPLTNEDSHTLMTLHMRHPPVRLTEAVVDAVRMLSEAAGDLADARQTLKDNEEEEEDDEIYALGAGVEGKVRMLLDEWEKINQIKTTLEAIGDEERSNRRRGENGNVEHVAPFLAFKDTMEEKQKSYKAKSAKEKYTNLEEYVSYRKLVHEAQNPNTAMPRAKDLTRTPLFGGPLKDEEEGGEGAADEDDDDDDIQVTTVSESLNCTLTLRLFVDPVITPCKHHFERSAIEEMIDQHARNQPRTNKKPFQCPTPGCSANYTKNDLKEDILMQRKVAKYKRKQERERQREEDRVAEGRSKGKGRVSRTVALDSDDDDEASRASSAKVKREMSQKPIKSRDSEVPTRRSRQTQEEQDEDEVEDQEEEEEEEELDEDGDSQML